MKTEDRELSTMSELVKGMVDGKNKNGQDQPPEFCHYRDEGCELAQSCLNCPFPQCVYEQPRGRRRWLKKARDKEIVRLFLSKGKSVKELAQVFWRQPAHHSAGNQAIRVVSIAS
jgi:hypothetical protein